VAAFSIGAAVLLSSSAGLQAQQAQKLKIGIAVPMSGPSARVGDEASKVAKWWAKKVNAENKTDVEIVVRDTTFKPADAIAAVERLVEEDHVSAIAGIWHSSQGIAVVPVVKRLKVPLFIMGASSPRVLAGDNINEKDFAWRPSTDDFVKGELVGDFLMKAVVPKFKHTPKVFYIGEDSDFARDFLDSTRNFIEKNGKGKVVNVGSTIYFQPNATTLLSELSSVRASGANIVITAPTGGVMAVFNNEMRKLQIPALDIGYAGEAAAQEFVDLTGDNRFGTVFYVYTTPGKPMTSKTLAWEAEFKKEVKGYSVPAGYSAIMWECLESIRHAYEAAKSADPVKINAAVPSIKFEGVRNQVVQYNPDTHNSTQMFLAIAQYQKGAPGLGFNIIWPAQVKDSELQIPAWVKQ
jgi:branched-chain amino acid transport system substrate-binding protein